MAVIPLMKSCLRCGAVKPSSRFYRNSAQRDGLQSWCKQCIRETYDPVYQHDYYMTNREILLPEHNKSAWRHYYKVSGIPKREEIKV